jgi:hypothetical protein
MMKRTYEEVFMDKKFVFTSINLNYIRHLLMEN